MTTANDRNRVVERLAFLRRLKLLRNVPIEDLATFSHIVGTAIVTNRQQQIYSNNSNRMHIIVEGECTMHFNKYNSANLSGVGVGGTLMGGCATKAKTPKGGAGGATESVASASSSRGGESSGNGAGCVSSFHSSSSSGLSAMGAGAGAKLSSDNSTVIARFGPGCVFWEASICRDLKHEWMNDWHVVIRSPTLKMYCVHRNDWMGMVRQPTGASGGMHGMSEGAGKPIVSDSIKRSFYEEARFKMQYYAARAKNIAEKVRKSQKESVGAAAVIVAAGGGNGGENGDRGGA